jgi:protein phosphatase
VNASPDRANIIVHVFGRTDVGRTREHNEDSFIVADLTTLNATLQPEVRTHTLGDRGSLFMVADGMGGAAAGEIASAMATEVVLNQLDLRWRQANDHEPETFARALKAAAEAANARIHKYAVEHPEVRGMGTTATIAGLLGDTLYLAQVGDSRAYIIRNGEARQITKDQSLMQKLVEAGELTAEEAEVSDRRNIILQALGPEPMVKVDLTSQRVSRGDTLVLCSDGLSGQVRAAEIGRIVSEEPDLVAACRKLIDLANENGGPDNITVITARFEGDGLAAPSSAEDVGHHAYQGETEQRITQPVQASSIPGYEGDTGELTVSPDEITADMDAIPATAGAGGVSGAEPTASAAVDDSLRPTIPSPNPEPVDAPPAAVAATPLPAGEPRVPVHVLRIIFGALAMVLAIFLLFSLLR